MNKTRVSDKFQCKKDSLSELFDFLKSSFQSEDFEKAEKILRSREEKIKLVKEAEMKRHSAELEDKVEKLEFRNIALEDGLKECKRKCDEMKERVIRVEEDFRVISERERRAQERIYVLCEDLELMERERTEVKVQMKTEIRDFERGKRRAEEEVDVWKKKFGELERRIVLLEEEATFFRCIDSIEDHFRGKLLNESGGLLGELSNEAQSKKDQHKARGNSGFTGAGVGQLRSNGNLLNTNNGNVHTSDVAGLNTSSIEKTRGLPSIDMQCKSLVNVNEEINSTCLESDMEQDRRVRKQIPFESEGSSYRKPSHEQGNLITPSRGMIDITDSEYDKDIAPKHASKVRDRGFDDDEKEQFLDNLKTASAGMIDVSDTDNEDEKNNEDEESSRKCLKRSYTDQSRDDQRSFCEENPVTSTSKRRRATTVTSESESEDGDKIPISKLNMKKPENLEEIAQIPSESPMNLHSQTLASGSEKLEESPSRKPLLSLRQCEEKNTIAGCDTTYNLNMSNQKAGSVLVENCKEDVVLEEVGSYSDGESSSDSSTDSEDEEDTNLGFNQLIAALRRKKDEKSKWQFEADMLSSFEKDPELCMKAVCAIYRQQTLNEKSAKGCLTNNGRGFNRFDAISGSNLAEFLMEGNKDGGLKKSVGELKKHDPRGLEDCKRLAKHYSKQLFTIYQNKEDPFFG